MARSISCSTAVPIAATPFACWKRAIAPRLPAPIIPGPSPTTALINYVFPEGYDGTDKSKLGLAKPPRVASYRGFVFASMAPQGPTLAEHLGGAIRTLDQACENSPTGELELSAGFLHHRTMANWKFILENECDGYHPGFVHSSIFSVSDSAIGSLNLRGDTMWAPRCLYRLRRVGGELKMAYKKVALVNNNKAIYTISFLI
jgi:hypothetical protein